MVLQEWSCGLYNSRSYCGNFQRNSIQLDLLRPLVNQRLINIEVMVDYFVNFPQCLCIGLEDVKKADI